MVGVKVVEMDDFSRCFYTSFIPLMPVNPLAVFCRKAKSKAFVIAAGLKEERAVDTVYVAVSTVDVTGYVGFVVD